MLTLSHRLQELSSQHGRGFSDLNGRDCSFFSCWWQRKSDSELHTPQALAQDLPRSHQFPESLLDAKAGGWMVRTSTGRDLETQTAGPWSAPDAAGGCFHRCKGSQSTSHISLTLRTSSGLHRGPQGTWLRSGEQGSPCESEAPGLPMEACFTIDPEL